LSFDLALYEPFKVTENYTYGKGRHYELPTGEIYPSVTTVLSSFYDKDKVLAAWKARKGEAEADRITRQAGDKGTIIHKLAEMHLLGQDYRTFPAPPFELSRFACIKRQLDAHVTTVYGIEFALYSHILRTAGRADLICLWDGIPSIVDFKTSIRPKKEEWIENYFVQSSCYGFMTYERLGLKIQQIVVLIVNDYDGEDVFVKSLNNYTSLLEKVFVQR
jgi:hypothetical protein